MECHSCARWGKRARFARPCFLFSHLLFATALRLCTVGSLVGILSIFGGVHQQDIFAFFTLVLRTYCAFFFNDSTKKGRDRQKKKKLRKVASYLCKPPSFRNCILNEHLISKQFLPSFVV